MAQPIHGARELEVFTNFLEITTLPTAIYHQYESEYTVATAAKCPSS